MLLIRHGATEANERRPYILQGASIDLPLSPTGRTQAGAVAAFLSSQPLAAVYSSGMRRAVETAEAIAGPHGREVATEPDLREVDVGQWEALDWLTIEQRFPEAYYAFRDDPGSTPYLGGESYADVQKRAMPVIERLLAKHAGETFAVVAHNVVNRACLAATLPLEIRYAKEIEQSNCCVNVIEARPGVRTRVRTLNSDFHVPAGGDPGA
jgi:broad specificity phosphatase PhoE